MIVASPLRDSAVSKEYQFKHGVSIRRNVQINWQDPVVTDNLSNQRVSEWKDRQYWLCVEESTPAGIAPVKCDPVKAARAAAIALQLICPIGGDHVFFGLRQHNSEWYVASIEDNLPLRNTLLGRTTRLENQGIVQHFELIYEGICRARSERIDRIQNAVALLEHGLQIDNYYISTLMFTMALDVIVVARGKEEFSHRIAGLLGPSSLVFPFNTVTGLQPAITVQSVVGPLYGYRNLLAHGRVIPKDHPCRKPFVLEDANGQRINHVDYCGAELMLEGALFLLTASLRKIMLDELVGLATNDRRWESEIKGREVKIKETSVFDLRPRQERTVRE